MKAKPIEILNSWFHNYSFTLNSMRQIIDFCLLNIAYASHIATSWFTSSFYKILNSFHTGSSVVVTEKENTAVAR